MSYTAKYASSLYGPFREAMGSNTSFGDKKTYQINPSNFSETLLEARLDEAEGSDILLVKPGVPYVDIIRLLRENYPSLLHIKFLGSVNDQRLGSPEEV